MAELVETYIDLPLGIVDAAVIAIAERLRLTEIAESYRDRGRAAWLLRGTRGRSCWGGNDSADRRCGPRLGRTGRRQGAGRLIQPLGSRRPY